MRRQGNPKAERGTTQWEVPFQLPFHHPRSDEDPKGKGKTKNGRQALEPLLQLATRVEGDEAEDGYRAGITTQRWSPAQNPEPKPPSTPTKLKFSRKTRQAKGVMNRSGSGSCTQPDVTEAIARSSKSQGDQVARHPRLLNRGESTGRRRRPRDSPENLHKWKPPFQPGGKQANTAKARPRKQRPGEQRKEKRNVSQS